MRNHRSLNFGKPVVASTKASVGSEMSIFEKVVSAMTHIFGTEKSHTEVVVVLTFLWVLLSRLFLSFHVSHVSFFSDRFFTVIFWQCQLSVIVLA